MQGGRARLPDVFIADKNDTAKFEGAQAGKFALMALAVRRGEGGQLVAIDHVTPAVSNPFVVRPGVRRHNYMHLLAAAVRLFSHIDLTWLRHCAAPAVSRKPQTLTRPCAEHWLHMLGVCCCSFRSRRSAP